jgi:L-amino acid N-acyltransferase YncA
MNQIRLATNADAESIAAIYGHYVTDTAISFEYVPPTAEQMAQRLANVLSKHPWLVYERAGEVLGYAYASQHQERAAYQWSVNVSVYLQHGLARQGIGRGLYVSLLGLLRLQGFYKAFAGLTLPNPASEGLHRALGFSSVGVYHDAGYKFGQWHDVLYLELLLQPLPANPIAPRSLQEAVADPAWPLALNAGLNLIRP